MTKRKRFSAESKRGVVERARQPGDSCAKVAQGVGMRDSLLMRWKRESESQPKVAFAGIGPTLIPRIIESIFVEEPGNTAYVLLDKPADESQCA